MQRADTFRAVALALASAAMILAGPVAAEESTYRYRAAIGVQQGAAFVQLPLSPGVYAHSLQPGLRDLRVVDASGERVPFALLEPRVALASASESLRAAALYPLPPRPADGSASLPPLEISLQAEGIVVTRRAAPPADRGPSPGWLFNLGERRAGDATATELLLAWTGPAEFSAGFRCETSDDLRAWRPAGAGQLMALASTAGALTQPRVMLPEGVGRFVRLEWVDASAPPQLTGAQAVRSGSAEVALDAPREWQLSPAVDAAGTAPAARAERALVFDLGGVMPLVQVDLELGSGTRVAPVRLQGRDAAEQAWRDLGGAVFYRLERDGAVQRSPALPLQATLRYLRVEPDERAAALDAAQTRLVVRAALPSLVFAAQGTPPFALLAGSATAAVSALPAQTLVPSLAQERRHFGRAALGEWAESPEALQKIQAEQRSAALRPWLLWAVLLAGVAGLGAMVWRLARGSGSAAKP